MTKILVCYRRQGCPNGRLFFKEIEADLDDVWGFIYSEIDESYTILDWTVTE